MQALQKLAYSLLSLGPKRLIILGVSGVLIFAMIFLSFHMFQKPVRSTLYSGLDKADVSAIGTVLSEVGMPFDVNEAGDSVLVDFGKTAQARMLLAERGLPKSDKSGYDIFDKMGSLGLTSFMQQVTKVRALEGELVRTILQIDGIKSARVHLALKAEGVLRNRDSRPTASVIIRLDGTPPEGLATVIRQLTAAAIPGLQADQVTVSTTDGKLLVGPRSSEDAVVGELLDLESRISRETEKRISNTLEPFAGNDNMRVSVSTTVNVDKRQTNETKFDPNSKVERSMFVQKSVDTSKDAGASPAVTVDQNIPQEVKPAEDAGTSNKKKEDKQETVNYEVDTKQTATTSAGYVVERMSVAVVLNKKILLGSPGNAAEGEPLKEDSELLKAKLAEIEAIVRSSSGTIESRGDTVRISAIDFFEGEKTDLVVEEPGVAHYLEGNLGALINAISLIVAILVVLFAGLRPALKMLLAAPSNAESAQGLMTAQLNPALSDQQSETDGLGVPAIADFGFDSSTGENTPKDQLNKLVRVDVDRAAQVIKKWLAEPERDAA